MDIGELMRRRHSGGKKVDIYKDMVTFDFTLTEGATLPITTSNISSLDKLIVDGEEVTPTASKSIVFSAGEHKIGWKMIDITTIPQGGIPGIKTLSNSSVFSSSVVIIPACVTQIGQYAMRGAPAYNQIMTICYPTVPPTCGNAAIGLWYSNATHPIYVLDDSIDLYKAAAQWSSYSAAYKGLSQLT